MAGAQTNQRERVEVVKGDEPVAANADTPEAFDRTMTLDARMAAITEDAFGIGKDTIKMKSKAGVEFTIKGHTVEAVLSEMRPLLARYRVRLKPSLFERTHTGNRCDVLVDFMFINLDDPKDSETVRWAGSGTDDGDRGFSKAGTNALKEMLKKVFLITDREDAKEETESVEHRTDDGVSRAGLDRAKEQRRAAIEQWAKTFKVALEKATDRKDVQRLQRENADQLASEDLPAVTRQFFFELIQQRLTAVAPKIAGDAELDADYALDLAP